MPIIEKSKHKKLAESVWETNKKSNRKEWILFHHAISFVDLASNANSEISVACVPKIKNKNHKGYQIKIQIVNQWDIVLNVNHNFVPNHNIVQ